MIRYARIDNNLVSNVFICSDSEIINMPGYNIKVTEQTRNAVVGGTYDFGNAKFIDPKPYESWILDEDFNWVSPVGPNPDPLTKLWDEDSQVWANR
jgi:hypothetical protein